MSEVRCVTHNPAGRRRVVTTRLLPGDRWLGLLTGAGYRVDVCDSDLPLATDDLLALVGGRCDAVIAQLTEHWDAALVEALGRAGGGVLSLYSVGHDNVDVAAATRLGIAVGNTPGVLTETTAELAVALTFAAARRIVEADGFLAAGRFTGWLPSLLLGKRLWGATLGVVGAGRIGRAYARMMVQGHAMDLVYFDPRPDPELETDVAAYGAFQAARGERPVTCRRAASLADLLGVADIVSLHAALTVDTRHLIDRAALAAMKPDAVLVNTARGPLIDEAALVEHCRRHPSFTAALDVLEDEPRAAPGLLELDNVIAVPHIGSATGWTRRGMAILAAANVVGVLSGLPAWRGDVAPFLGDDPPHAAPSIVNADDLGLARAEVGGTAPGAVSAHG